MRRFAAALVAALALAGPAVAWENQGHMAVGALAYDDLARSHPEVVRAVADLMRSHPDRARFERELGAATGGARDRLMFEYMARWPDDIRGTRFDRPDEHYEVKVVSPWRFAMPLAFGKARRSFLTNLAVARDVHAAPADRAVALCWVLHLVGDMHQPLHGGHWMSPRFPKTDRAGTIAWVRTAPGARPVTLHHVWDSAADRPGPEADAAAELARRARGVARAFAAPPAAPAPAAAFSRWAEADRRLALVDAYDGGRFEGTATPEGAPVLSPAYLGRARALAERRIGEAGDQLAAELVGLRLR